MRDTLEQMLTLPVLVTVLVCLYGTTAAGPFPPDGGSWPTATPESQGMSTELLAAAPSKMCIKNGDTWVQSIQAGNAIVIRNGYDVYHYGNPYGSMEGWASGTRSIVVTLFGMALKQGKIAGGQTALETPVNQINSATAKTYGSSTLLKHIISYTSCFDPSGSGWEYGCAPEWGHQHFILEELYGSHPASLINNVLGPAVGADWRTEEWYQTDGYYTYKGYDEPWPMAILHATPAHAARWGYLLLNQGNWNGTQIIDSWFVDRMLTPMTKPDGSGFANKHEGGCTHLNYSGMWGDIIPHDAFAALGSHSSMIFVCPSLNLVVARAGDELYETTTRDGLEVRDIRGMVEPIIEAVIGGVTPTVSTPTISPAGGTHLNSVSVTLACATSGATIRYTTDGSTPTSSSTAYSSAFSLTGSKTVKAKAFKDGMTESGTAGASFTIVGKPSLPFSMNCGPTSPAVSGWTNDDGYMTDGDDYSTDAGFITDGVADAAPADLYKTCSRDEPVFAIPVDNGTYTVRLHFAEPAKATVAEADAARHMTVQVEGTTVLSDFSPAGAAGAVKTAYVHTVQTTVTDGSLDIQLQNDSGNDSFIMGIEVLESTTTIMIHTDNGIWHTEDLSALSARSGYDMQGRMVDLRKAEPGVYLERRMTAAGPVYEKITVVK